MFQKFTRPLSKPHSIVKIILFGIFAAKFFDHVFTHALKIFWQIYPKIYNFLNQSRFIKRSIGILCLIFEISLNAQMVFETPPENFHPQFDIATCYLIYDEKVLYLKRTSTKIWATMWGLPGGCVELGETPMIAMIREVFEETGMDISREKITPLGKVYVRDPKKDFNYHMFACILPSFPQKIALSNDEHIDYLWITPENALKDLQLVPGEDETLRLFKKKFLK
jgi:8-oxo-dGTP pyrophosphatase MutT (NUDIX family)